MAYNVLIVDDSVLIRSMVAKTLKVTGVPIGTYHYAAHGREALDKLERNWIDIVFADINMPVMDGIEMLDAMRSRDFLADIPVVVISTEQSEERIQKLKAKGVQDYLKKPFMPEQFKAIVEKHLGKGKSVH
jgi:two-component system chemotaxis response regulator CheY